MNVNYNEIILVDGEPAILVARSGPVDIFHRLSATVGITGDDVKVNTAAEKDRISAFGTEMYSIRDYLYDKGLTTCVKPNIMQVYKPICPMLSNKRHIFDITIADSNRKCEKITNIRFWHVKTVAKIALWMAANKEKCVGVFGKAFIDRVEQYKKMQESIKKQENQQ